MNIMILWLILLYPVDRMAGAGWAATTVNYVWPLSLGLFSVFVNCNFLFTTFL